MYPFGMLFIAQSVKSLRKKYPSCEIVCDNIDLDGAASYAAHMAFFTSCGFPIGNNPSFRPGSTTYIPITYAYASQLRSRDEIEDISLGLAKQLTMSNDGKLVDALSYSFREIIRNVIEHSESKTFAYCAQYWPTKDLVEVAILDTGIGLRKSLSDNPHLQLKSDKDAIKLALMPGISGKNYEGVKQQPDDHWQNSGYGLYMNYRLCNEGGSFFICSGQSGMSRTTDNKSDYHDTNFSGTALRLRMNTRNLLSVSSMLDQFRHEGQSHARKFGKGAVLNASTMSVMLKDNFKLLAEQIKVGDTIRHQKFGNGVVTEKQITLQGEMLWITFDGGRRKKVLSVDVFIISEDHQLTSEEIESSDFMDSLSENSSLPPDENHDANSFDDFW